MKRFVAWILVFVFAVGLLGCGTAQQKDRETEKPTDNTAVTTAKPEPEPVQDTVEPTEEPEADAPENGIWNADTLFTLGTVNGDAYESTFLGYGIRLENWTFADEKQIAEANNWGEQYLSSDIQELIDQSETFTEMFAESEDGMANINIQYQKKAIYKSIELDAMIDMIIPEMKNTFEQAGYTNLVMEKTSVTLGGDVYPGINITGEVYGVPVYQRQVYIQRGEYVAYITLTCFVENTLDSIVACFYKL
jgi:hypothetical protein